MSTPAAKRRRVDAANVTLRKPFQSPMIRRPNAEGTPGTSNTPDAVGSKRSIAENGTPQTPLPKAKQRLGPSKSYEEALRHSPQLPSSPQLKRKLSLHQPFNTGRQSTKADGGDDDNPFLALVTAHKKEQEMVIKDLDQRLETVRQAKRIEAQSKDGEEVDQELKDLVVKWKSASRQAAEELFEMVKGRVASAGGSKAWKGMRESQANFYQDFDGGNSSKPKHEAHEDEEEEREGFSNGDEETPKSEESEQDPSGEGSESEFNMHAMLQSLNIDPSLLGYNAAEDRWID